MRRADLDPDPLRQFERWFEHDRVALATATPDGRPSVRMVLLKGFDRNGFVFYTSYESRKGRELEANPYSALLFHWNGRQVRIEGRVERVSAADADAYWRTRPIGSRLSAAASAQSEPIAAREELEAAVERVRHELGDDPPRPARWGGYRLVPDRFEFWEHRDDRLHDRFLYEPTDGGWTTVRLQP